jgi:hypothetical protein
MLYIGIDPGKNGAIAFIDDNDDSSARSFSMPDGPRLIADLLINISSGSDCMAAIEKVHSMPSQGVRSVFTFGEHFGIVQGILATLFIPMERPSPKTWQSVIVSPPTNGDRKLVSLDYARRMFPHVDLKRKKDHDRAEALLIAMWLRSHRKGERWK